MDLEAVDHQLDDPALLLSEGAPHKMGVCPVREIPLTLHQYLTAGPKPPRVIAPSEFSAVDSLHAAYLALNAAQQSQDVDSPLCSEYNAESPMSLTAHAAKSALALLCSESGMTASDAVEIWAAMIDNGCSAEHNYTHVRFANY